MVEPFLKLFVYRVEESFEDLDDLFSMKGVTIPYLVPKLLKKRRFSQVGLIPNFRKFEMMSDSTPCRAT